MFDLPEQIGALDAVNRSVCRAQLELLRRIRKIDEAQVWRDSGARDTAHWLSMRYDISAWKARRWIAAAHALDLLPRLAETFGRGEIGLDKVVELARFATDETEGGLIAWARTVSCAAVRRRGDLEVRVASEDVVDAERARCVSWWYVDQGRRFGLEAELPAEQGAIVARALERVAETIPAMPDEEDSCFVSARRADALVALCSAGLAGDAEGVRATVVIHAQADRLADGSGGCEVEEGPVIYPESVGRLLCNARVQAVVEDAGGDVLALGRMSREPSAWQMRQVRYRDRECRFPGCGARRFTEAHHIVWRRDGGRTDLANLVLICSFHHRLVHEHGWSIRQGDGEIGWFRPNGVRYRAGPSPGAYEKTPLVAATG